MRPWCFGGADIADVDGLCRAKELGISLVLMGIGKVIVVGVGKGHTSVTIGVKEMLLKHSKLEYRRLVVSKEQVCRLV